MLPRQTTELGAWGSEAINNNISTGQLGSQRTIIREKESCTLLVHQAIENRVTEIKLYNKVVHYNLRKYVLSGSTHSDLVHDE